MKSMFVIIFLIEIFFLFLLSRSLHARLSFLINNFTNNRKVMVWLLAIIFFPGTLIHELAHFIAAILLFVPAGKISLWPSYDKKRMKFGSVMIGKCDPFRSFIISIAPFLAGNLIIFSTLNFFVNNRSLFGFPHMAVIFYLLVVVANTMFLSRNDFGGVWKLLLILVIIYLILHTGGIQFSWDKLSSALTPVEPVMKLMDIFLLAPIVVNIGAISILALISPSNLFRIEDKE